MLYKKLIILLLFLFIFSACAKKEATPSTSPFIGGTEGVELLFYEGSPPKEVFDSGDFPFDVVVKLKNKGEWHIPKENIFVMIDGMRPEEFSKTLADLKKQPEEDIEARRKDTRGNILESNPVFVEFKDFNHISPIVGVSQPFPFRSRACYSYGTTANSLLCVRKNLMSPKDGICTLDEQKKLFNSGGPVQFSELTESRRAANKIGFTFKVSHAAAGDLFKPNNECNLNDRSTFDKISLKVDTGMTGLACSGLTQQSDTAREGIIGLYGGEKIVSCTQEIDSLSDYEFPVILEATYVYMDSITTEVVVKHSEI